MAVAAPRSWGGCATHAAARGPLPRIAACERASCIDCRAPPVIVDSGAIRSTATCRHLHTLNSKI
jgi:hypothetical protein